MSENLQKLIGVVVMAVLVVVGVVVSSGDDTDFTRNTAFGVPKLGGGLDDQVQQPGDAENDLVLAMAAAAKCGEGHVLISTGDPVSPWRCGPLISDVAMAVVEEARPKPVLPRSSGRPCGWAADLGYWLAKADEDAWIQRSNRDDERVLDHRELGWSLYAAVECLRDHATGATPEQVVVWLEDYGFRNIPLNEGWGWGKTSHPEISSLRVGIWVDDASGLVRELETEAGPSGWDYPHSRYFRR